MKGWYKALEDLVWLTQLGLNMLLPLVMCLGGAWWAVNSWSWPEWVFLPAILLGLASGAQNFWYFAKEHLDRAKKEKPKRDIRKRIFTIRCSPKNSCISKWRSFHARKWAQWEKTMKLSDKSKYIL